MFVCESSTITELLVNCQGDMVADLSGPKDYDLPDASEFQCYFCGANAEYVEGV
jgi:hypothetical protein